MEIFTRLYGTHFYVKSKSTSNDEMRTFIEHIIDPLIDYIAEHIRKAYERAHQIELQSKTEFPSALTATNSTIVLNSNVGGNVATTVTLQSEARESAQEIIKEMAEILASQSINNADDILEILEEINNSLKENLKPKKGFLTALKSLCSGTAAIAGLATALIRAC